MTLLFTDGIGPAKPDVDIVNHPPHYNNHPSGVECIQITEHMNFNLGNVIKYVWRADEKGEAVEDLSKARFYLDREIARREYLAQQQGHDVLTPEMATNVLDWLTGQGPFPLPSFEETFGDTEREYEAFIGEADEELSFWVQEDEDGDLELVIPMGNPEDDDEPAEAIGTAACDILAGVPVGLYYDEDEGTITFTPVLDFTVPVGRQPEVETTVTDVYVDLIPADPFLDPQVLQRVDELTKAPEFQNFTNWVSEKLADLHREQAAQDERLNQKVFG